MTRASPAAPLAAKLLAAVLAVGAALLTLVVVMRVAGDNPTATAVTVPVAPTVPEAAAWCPGLMAALPDTIAGMRERPVESPSPYVAAWGDPEVVLRCGVPAPVDLTPTSSLLSVNGVDWLQSRNGSGVIWTATGRVVFVDVTVPQSDASQESILVPISAAIASSLPTADRSAPTPGPSAP